jgi:hypothetical protein
MSGHSLLNASRKRLRTSLPRALFGNRKFFSAGWRAIALSAMTEALRPLILDLPGHLREKVHDGAEPGGRGWSEVENPARMARQPGQDFGMFVGGVVVEDDMELVAHVKNTCNMVEIGRKTDMRGL